MLSEVPEGYLGKLKVHRSGRTRYLYYYRTGYDISGYNIISQCFLFQLHTFGSICFWALHQGKYGSALLLYSLCCRVDPDINVVKSFIKIAFLAFFSSRNTPFAN